MHNIVCCTWCPTEMNVILNRGTFDLNLAKNYTNWRHSNSGLFLFECVQANWLQSSVFCGCRGMCFVLNMDQMLSLNFLLQSQWRNRQISQPKFPNHVREKHTPHFCCCLHPPALYPIFCLSLIIRQTYLFPINTLLSLRARERTQLTKTTENKEWLERFADKSTVEILDCKYERVKITKVMKG